MAQPYTSQLILITPVWTLAAETGTVTYWYHPSGNASLTSAQLATIASDLGSTIKVYLQARHPTVVQLVRTEARQYRTTGTQVTGVDSTNCVYTGTNGSEALPLQVAAVVKLDTGFAGKSYRGRHYFPFFAESDNSGGTTSSTLQAALANVEDLTLSVGGITCNQVVFSRTLDSWQEVTSATPRTYWGTQRRRRNEYLT